jgi:glycosyltransferase involved in cell wall biosynthesis
MIMGKTAKILTIYYKHKRGGFCKRIKMKIEAYLEKGWVVHYVAVARYPYEDKNLIPHIIPQLLPKAEGILFWMYFFLVAPIYSIFLSLKYRFTLISAVSPVYAWICTPSKWITKTPMVTFLLTKPKFTTDCHEQYQSLAPLEKWMENAGLNSSNLIIANSHACRDEWVNQMGANKNNIEVHPNNTAQLVFDKERQRQNLEEEFSLDSDDFIIATSGILESHKNIETVIKAFSKNINSHAILLIIGEGEQKSSLTILSRELNLTDKIIFTGWRSDVTSLLQGADMFVLPSRREGMSEALLEAGASGLPCLVSSISENMEVIRDPEHHFHFEDAELLAEKINRAIGDPTYYENLLVNTKSDVERFYFNWKEQLVERLGKFVK